MSTSLAFRLDEPQFETLRRLIHEHTGIALAPSKRVLLESRLAKRLRALGLQSFADYCRHLDTELDSELVPLINCVTTNKTDFFREPHHFQFLRTSVLPAAEARAGINGPRKLRIWSAGCSTGEEPYTIAMVLREWLQGRSGWDVRILASDIDTNVLHHASTGRYTAERLSDVPDDLRRRWFKPVEGDLFEADEALKSLITFRRINFVEQPWPIRTTFDVIFCRNVIIYFNRETQSELLQRFASLLAPDGHMIIGHSESLAWLTDVFTSVPRQPTVYTLAGAGRAAAAPGTPRKVGAVAAAAPAAVARPSASAARHEAEYLGIGDVLASATPRTLRTVLGTCVTIALFDTVSGTGGATHFLTPAPGPSAAAIADEERTRFGDAAMSELLRRVTRLGASPDRLKAKLFGGAAVLPGQQGEALARQNIAFARAALDRAGIPVVAERLGGRSPIEVIFFTDSGRALVRDVPLESCGALEHEVELLSAAEGRIRTLMAGQAQAAGAQG